MNTALKCKISISIALLSLVAHAPLIGEDATAADDLILFESKEGKFSIRLPAKPKSDTTTVGDAGETQVQFTTEAANGVYLVSYQDNPNLEGKSPKEIAAALELGRDRLKEVFAGEFLENKTITLDEKHPGLRFRLTMPLAKGEARCTFYMVGTRLYQILVIGVPEFVNSTQATEVINSFKFLP